MQRPKVFPPSKEELDKITVEISVLTEPEDITTDPENYKDVIKIGRDGLIIYHPFGSGLLLPQVPVEHNWRVEEFLENLCYKAGLNPGCWRDPNTKIYRFEAEIFKELKPKGKVIKYA